ncbi:oxidoreductase [Frigidibacter sp. SD6-1]|uniref:oxidoreductase n=1 Tax=Frigidibacter sp. SD6-1 TaxID=3032581 RepID=UPI0024DF38F3|nr:oxidoreductase [Frigidibacter sp. SD6-1]
MRKVVYAALAGFAFFGASPLLAQEVVLTLSGAIAGQDGSTSVELTMEDLQELPRERFETTTIWTEGPQVFEGVSLRILLDHVQAAEGEIRASALNDYTITIPTADAVEGGPIVAFSRNGAEMAVRDKGPLWIVYPFDIVDRYKSEEYYSRSIWQLSRMEIVAKD